MNIPKETIINKPNAKAVKKIATKVVPNQNQNQNPIPVLKREKPQEICANIDHIYDKKCDNNKQLLKSEEDNRDSLENEENATTNNLLYPHLDDPNFNVKIALKKEFNDTKYDGTIYSVKDYAEILSKAEYELLPQQAFVRNFMSFQTPYNSLLLFHGLGSGKTCSAIGVCEEMRDYLKQMGISKQIIIVASPNVQDNFRLQLFDERKLKEVDGIWTTKGCLGNKLLKEINPTGMKGLTREKVIQQVKNLINMSYYFVGYLQFSNDIVRKSGKPELPAEAKIRNLQNAYNDNLIVIDEVHNIRISDDNENKTVAKNLMYLVSVVNNLRLLLLSATPMFNNYKEIVWLLNLMNMNDKRGIISVSDIFDKNGEFKDDSNGISGRDMLIRKASGYVSYVRGENPYTFPFRVYPNKFAPDLTFKSKSEYPKYQLNGKKIPDDRKIEKLSICLTLIGEYQELGYKYIIDRLLARQEGVKQTKTGKQKIVPSFKSQKSFGYIDLQVPLGALNIVYPLEPGLLESLTEGIEGAEFDEEYEEVMDDLQPIINREREREVDIVEEIDEVMNNGPKIEHSVRSDIQNKEQMEIETKTETETEQLIVNSEIESEPGVTEGIDGDVKLFDEVIELNASKIKSNKKPKTLEFLEIQEKAIPNKKVKGSFIETIVAKKVPEPEKPNAIAIKEKKTKEPKEPKAKEPKEKEPKEPKVPKPRAKKAHIIEGPTVSQLPSKKNELMSLEMSLKKGGDINGENPSNSNLPLASGKKLFINPKELTGSEGLKRIMSFIDEKTPAQKGDFEYKRNVPHIFDPSEIGKYSAKIKNICESIYNSKTNTVSDGIILIYSAYLDAGLIPMALALESMGFTRFGKNTKSLFKAGKNSAQPVDVRTMTPMQQSSNRKDFRPASYSMITGDPRISPNNDFEMKGITNDDNIDGHKVKVVLISQAGSEGLDFKAIRQIHILEPWYNVNRIEQIIGRGVRNFSHKDLPFEKRNVQIFLYGTMLKNANEEAADLYVYRISEIKAVKIGKVTRLLKETSVDCLINHDQTQFTPENFNQIDENQNISQVLANHTELKNFEIGDLPNSATCDYMDTCEYKCIPVDETGIDDSLLNYDTYNETFMLVNSDKIIQKVKMLYRMRFFYKKRDLLQLINIPKQYPIAQIYSALSQMINDNTEYLIDKYGRTGYLVNIGDYYLFQPSELNYEGISTYDRSVPLDFKHNKIHFDIKEDNIKPVNRNVEQTIIQVNRDAINNKEDAAMNNKDANNKDADNNNDAINDVVKTMFENYKTSLNSSSIEKGNKNWYQHCGVVIRKMKKNTGDLDESKIDLELLNVFLIEHIVDSLMMSEKVSLLNYLYFNNKIDRLFPGDQIFKRFITTVKTYLMSKMIIFKNITGIIMFNGPSRIDNLHIFVLNNNNNNKWLPAEPEDTLKLQQPISNKYKLTKEQIVSLNKYVGFIGFETNRKYMIYKVKDTTNSRSTGFRCDQSGKENVVEVLNQINEDGLTSKGTKDSAFELCIIQEFSLRNKQREMDDSNKIWFLDTETAIFNEFEKKEKM